MSQSFIISIAVAPIVGSTKASRALLYTGISSGKITSSIS